MSKEPSLQKLSDSPGITLTLSEGGLRDTTQDAWKDTGLPEHIQLRMVTIAKAAFGASAVFELLARDSCHQQDVANNQNVRYAQLDQCTRGGLEEAMDALLSTLVHEIETIRDVLITQREQVHE